MPNDLASLGFAGSGGCIGSNDDCDPILHTNNMIYHLTADDVRVIKEIGDGRYNAARSRNIVDQQQGDQSSALTDRTGVAAELAVANSFGGTWNKNLGVPDGQQGDVTLPSGETISVKSSLHPEAHWVLVAPSQGKVKDDMMVFVVPETRDTQPENMIIVGWLPAAKFNSLLRLTLHPSMTPGTKGVLRSELWPIS